jgi:ribosomal protein L35
LPQQILPDGGLDFFYKICNIGNLIMKTNKSYTKRLKVTRTGKVLGRKMGQNHFNAKESGSEGLLKKKMQPFKMSQKDKSRFLPSRNTRMTRKTNNTSI